MASDSSTSLYCSDEDYTQLMKELCDENNRLKEENEGLKKEKIQAELRVRLADNLEKKCANLQQEVEQLRKKDKTPPAAHPSDPVKTPSPTPLPPHVALHNHLSFSPPNKVRPPPLSYPAPQYEREVEATARFRFAAVRTMANYEKRLSDPQLVAGVPWRMQIERLCPQIAPDQPGPGPAIFKLICEDSALVKDSTFHGACHLAFFELRVVNQLSNKEETAEERRIYDTIAFAFPWASIIRSDTGFTSADGALWVSAEWIFHRKPRVAIDHPVVSDFVFLVEGRRVYASQEYLALHSKYFHTLFYSGFTEHGHGQLELKNVRYAEFVEFLRVVLPEHKPITKYNVEFLLELADRFDAPTVTNMCSAYIINRMHNEVNERVLEAIKSMAVHYRLFKVRREVERKLLRCARRQQNEAAAAMERAGQK